MASRHYRKNWIAEDDLEDDGAWNREMTSSLIRLPSSSQRAAATLHCQLAACASGCSQEAWLQHTHRHGLVRIRGKLANWRLPSPLVFERITPTPCCSWPGRASLYPMSRPSISAAGCAFSTSKDVLRLKLA